MGPPIGMQIYFALALCLSHKELLLLYETEIFALFAQFLKTVLAQMNL